MQKQKQLINLYIHPRHGGPVMLLQWDVPAISDLLGSGLNTDARTQGLANLIRASFPDVKPEQDWAKLRRVAERLIMIESFDGIVLQLSGTIASETEKTIEEVARMRKEIERLHQALQSERQQRVQWQSKAESYKTQVERLQKTQKLQEDLVLQNKQLQEEQRTWQNQKAASQGRLNELQQQVGGHRIQMDAREQEYKIQMGALEQKYKAQLETMEQDLKQRSGRAQELAEARRDLHDEQRKNKQLVATIEQLTQENNKLKQQNAKALETDLFGDIDNNPHVQQGPLIL